MRRKGDGVEPGNRHASDRVEIRESLAKMQSRCGRRSNLPAEEWWDVGAHYRCLDTKANREGVEVKL